MENDKICYNCGTHNNSDSNYCNSCGKQLIQNDTVANVDNNTQQNINSNNVIDQEGNIYGIISLILFFGGTPLISFLLNYLPSGVRYSFSSLTGLCPLSGIIVMTIGRVKYPNNKLLKVVMWIILGSIIISVIIFILFVIWCYVTCSNMDTRGCD